MDNDDAREWLVAVALAVFLSAGTVLFYAMAWGIFTGQITEF